MTRDRRLARLLLRIPPRVRRDRPRSDPRQESELAAAHGMERKRIIEAIVLHLARHPGAKDSVRGIVLWCRTARRTAPPEALVQDVLDELVRARRVGSSVLVDGTRIYHAP